jgi:hypothetical protein
MLNYVEEANGLAGAPRTEGEDAMTKVTVSRTSKVTRTSSATSPPKRGTVAGRNGKSGRGAPARKSIEELAAEQGVKPTTLEDILGKGADLWENNQEFERFVEDIYARRREDRELAKP